MVNGLFFFVYFKQSAISNPNQGLKKIEEDSVGPKFVLHQEGPTTAVGRLSAALLSAFGAGTGTGSGKMEQDSSDGGLQHYHTSQKDINRDIHLDKMIHHFMKDHPQVDFQLTSFPEELSKKLI